MTDTIEARRQRAAESRWFQQWPGLFDSAAQGSEGAASYHCATPLYRRANALDMVSSGNIVGTVADFTALARTILPNVLAASMFTGVTGSAFGIGTNCLTGTVTVLRTKLPATSGAHWDEANESLSEGVRQDTRATSSAGARLRVERLASIQAALGLPMQVLADILNISRPGLYKWLDASKDTTLQEASRQRLASVERLAKIWRQRINIPLNNVAHEPLARGHTVLQMFTDENLDEAGIIAAFDELVDKLRARPKSLTERMAEAGFTPRKSRRSPPEDE